MTKPLKRKKPDLYHYKNGKKINGAHAELRGNCSGLEGNCSGLWGDLDEITPEQRSQHPYIGYWVGN